MEKIKQLSVLPTLIEDPSVVGLLKVKFILNIAERKKRREINSEILNCVQ